MEYINKVYVITGAGNGIGKALTLLLLSKGAKVAAIDLRNHYLEELKRETIGYSGMISFHTANIADINSVQALPKEILNHFGKIDVIINNAGIIQPFIPFKDLDWDTIDRVMQVNLYGTLYMIKAFYPYLEKSNDAAIINISSMGGFMPFPGQSMYGASKAAVKLLTESLYAECKDTNIRVHIVFPGAIATNVTQNSGVATPKMQAGKSSKIQALAVEVAAHEILKGVASGKLHIYVGKDSKMLHWLYRLSPKKAINTIVDKMKNR